jgi:hypothetical protein
LVNDAGVEWSLQFLEFSEKLKYESPFTKHQIKVPAPAPMDHGSLDGIVIDLLLNPSILEHKAINRYAFERYYKGELPSDYFTQCATYSWGAQKLHPALNKGVLLIKCKDTARYMEYLWSYDSPNDVFSWEYTDDRGVKHEGKVEGILKTAIDRFQAILNCIATKVLPLREYDASNWHCSYCQYEGQCWADYEKTLVELKTADELPEEISNKCAYYLEVNGHLSEMEKEKDALKESIKSLLIGAGIGAGKTDRYSVTLKTQERRTIDKELLTAEEIARATKVSKSDVLTIRNLTRRAK